LTHKVAHRISSPRVVKIYDGQPCESMKKEHPQLISLTNLLEQW
jgi:hypothetical protein